MSRQTNLAKEFLKTHKTLVEYVYDGNGFKKGVVVAIGPDQVGFSLVAKEDYKVYTGSYANIPAVKELFELGFNDPDVKAKMDPESFSKIFFSLPAFKDLQRYGKIFYPNFRKSLGLSIAIHRALNSYVPKKKFFQNEETNTWEYTQYPFDDDLEATINRVYDRSRSGFFDETEVLEIKS